MGRNGGGYSRNRDYRLPQNGYADRSAGVNPGGAGTGGSSDSSARGQLDYPVKEHSSDKSEMISSLEKKVAGVSQDFTQAIHKISEKENEKFDLIFAILSELQQRQAHLEESVRSLKSQYGVNGQCMVPNGNVNVPMQQPQQQFAGSGPNQQYGQMNGQIPMGVQMNGNQQPMQQQFTGVMQPDGSQQMFTQVMQPQQMIIMQQPANAGMQYAAVPQMMTPQGAVVQQMPQQMAMQFIQQQSNTQDMGVVYPMNNGQENCQVQPGSIQAQMNMIKGDEIGNGQWEGGNDVNGQPQQQGSEVQGQNGCMGTSDASSQEGKLDDVSTQAPGAATRSSSATP